MRIILAALCVASVFATLFLFSGERLQATPIYAVRAANRCSTCHIEPIGWFDPAEQGDRGCTLDCQSCHVNRTGGGMRNPYGRFYQDEVLPTFSLGNRPSEFANPESYRGRDTYSTEGRYRLWEGFSGWTSGDTPMEQIGDRLGDINPDPYFRAGLDFRMMAYFPKGGDAAVFPMQADVHMWGDLPVEDLTVYGTLGLQGRQNRTINNAKAQSKLGQLVTVRELVVDWGGVPYNGYVRAGRFTKPYGWRHPDHTLFTRSPLSQSQYSQVYGVEAGINPNYPFANAALFYQGWDDFPGDLATPGWGFSTTAGYRDLGWQAGGSFEALSLTGGDTKLTVGPMWGLNFYPVTYIGEIDLRLEKSAGGSFQNGLYLLNEVNYLITQGVTVLLTHNWFQRFLDEPGTGRQRIILGAQWDILPSVQLATQYRVTMAQGETTQDFLIWTHLWY